MSKYSNSPFRPISEPARSIWDAFQDEASKRNGRDFDVWEEAEIKAVHECACKMAVQHGLREPTIKEVRQAQTMALGHADYGTKWSLGVVEAMMRPAAVVPL